MKKAESSSSLPVQAAAYTSQLGRVGEIARYLQSRRAELALQPGLSGGGLGAFLFFYALAQQEGGEAYAVEAESLLTALLPKAFEDAARRPLFQRELAEQASLIHFLQERSYLDSSFDHLLEIMEARLQHLVAGAVARKDFDPFTGYLSGAAYFLRRASASAAGPTVLRHVIDTLLGSYERLGEGGVWRSVFRGTQVYTGWSHGMSAILLFLAQVLETGGEYREADIRDALHGAAVYLCSLADKETAAFIPDIAGSGGTGNSLNLCYGDLGTGYSLLRTGRVLGETALQERAMRCLLQAAGRRDAAACQVHDASLIYGASGTALLFRKLQEMTGSAAFGEAATFWYGQAWGLSQHKGEVAGFKGTYNQTDNQRKLSLFEGLPGYGLAILEFEREPVGLLELIGY